MKSNRERPQFAIVCPNALTVIGLRQLLQSVMSTIEVVAYPSVQELREDNPERFVHFFVEFNMLLTDERIQRLENYLYPLVPPTVKIDVDNGCIGRDGCSNASGTSRLTVLIDK